MLEKLFGLIKAKECLSKIKALRDDYEFKIAELRKSIDEVEKHRNESLNLSKKTNENNIILTNENFRLRNDVIRLEKEIRYLKQSIKKLTGERFDMAMSLRGMFK